MDAVIAILTILSMKGGYSVVNVSFPHRLTSMAGTDSRVRCAPRFYNDVCSVTEKQIPQVIMTNSNGLLNELKW